MTHLRKGIDHVGVSVVYVCHDGEGNYVFSKRGAAARDENGRWDCGGGGLEVHDTVEGTLRKEIAEDYCTKVISYEFLGYRDVHREHGGEKTHWVALDFKVLVNRETVQNGEPHKFDEIGWFRLSDLPQLLHSQLPTFFNQYADRL